jgi:hypothetical protein
VLPRIVGAIENGEAEVTPVLSEALTTERCNPLALAVGASSSSSPCIAVPPALAACAVESARAADYDWLLGQRGRS